MQLNDWQRIEKIVRWTGLSVNSFALNIGLSRGENLYQIKRGNNGISKELAEQIAAKYPEINRAWVLTGQGGMFIGEGERAAIPAYDIDIVYLSGLDKLPEPSHTLSVPRVKDSSMAALVMNKAMEPEIPNGATVLVKQIRPEQIVPGYPHVVVTDRISVLRTVRKAAEDDKLRLRAANPDFDDIIIDTCEIRKVFVVKGHIYYNQ